MSGSGHRNALKLFVTTVTAATMALLALAGPAFGDAYSDLASSEADYANAQARTTAASRELKLREEALTRIDARAEAAEQQASAAEDRIAAAEDSLTAERLEAKATVDQMIADYSNDKDEHDASQAVGIGVGLAFLLFAVLTWFFHRIRTSRRIRELTADGSSRKAPILVIALLFLAGLIFFNRGWILNLIAGFLFTASIGLTVYLIILVVKARQPDEVSEQANRQSRRWLIPALTGVFFLLFVGLLGSSFFAPAPEKPDPPSEMLQAARDADGDPADPPNDEVLAAESAAVAPKRRAEALSRASDSAAKAAASTRRELRISSRELRRAGRAVRRNTRRVSRVEAEARRAAARQAVADAAAAAAAASVPSYSSCDTAPSDIPVPPGSDLDADGDGIGCES